MNPIVLIALVIFSAITSSYQQKCDQAGLKRFDELLSMVMATGNPNMQYPESPEQLKKWCSLNNKYIDEIKQYNNKCNTQLFRQLFKVFTYAFRKTMKGYCKPGTKFSSILIESSTCFNKNKNIQLKCVTNFIDRILGSLNEPDDKKKIPHYCCSYSKYLNCFPENMVSSPSCTENKVTAMTDFMKSQYSQAMDLICGDFNEDSDRCTRLGEPPKKRKGQRRSKSPAIPAGELFNSFPAV